MKILGKAINDTLTDNESSIEDKNENFNSDEGLNYITFTSIVKSELGEENEKNEDLGRLNSSVEELENEGNL